MIPFYMEDAEYPLLSEALEAAIRAWGEAAWAYNDEETTQRLKHLKDLKARLDGQYERQKPVLHRDRYERKAKKPPSYNTPEHLAKMLEERAGELDKEGKYPATARLMRENAKRLREEVA